MRVSYIYVKNQIVFAEATGHRPYPAKIIHADYTTGVYKVSFIGYKSTCVLLAKDLEKFTPEIVAKYEKACQDIDDKEGKTILKKIAIAKKEQSKMYKRKTLMLQTSQNSIDHAASVELSKSKDSSREKKSEILEKKQEQQLQDFYDQFPQSQQQNEQEARFKIKNLVKMRKTFPSQKENQLKEYPQTNQLVIEGMQEDLQQLSSFHSNKAQSSNNEEQQESSHSQIGIAKVKEEEDGPWMEIQTPQTISAESLHFSFPPKRQKYIKDLLPDTIKEVQQSDMSESSIQYQRQLTFTMEERPNNTVELQKLEEDDSEASIVHQQLGVCKEVDIYGIGSDFDEFSLANDDYRGMLITMNYRLAKLSMLNSNGIIHHLSKFLDLLLVLIQRGKNKQTPQEILMKKRQYLMAILSMENLEISNFLQQDCLFKMIDFACIYAQSSKPVQNAYFIENCHIRGRLQVLFMKFSKSLQAGLAGQRWEEVIHAFERFHKVRVIIR